MKATFSYEGKNFIVESTTYSSNEATALMVYRNGHKDNLDIITVNLPESILHSEDFAYIDTNNYSWAEDFLQKTGLGQKTDCYGHSGFCSYPLYHLNLEMLK